MDKVSVEKLREMPLAQVIEGFGGKRDPSDPTRNWKTHVGRMTINDGRFYNHDRGEGGGGAIDLTMHLGGFGFKEAVSWLQKGRSYVADAIPSVSQAQAKPKLAVPGSAPARIQQVKRYLVDTRAIPDALVQTSIDKGRLWADRYGNAVFGLRDLEGRRVGAELRGTTEKPFHGVRGSKGLFFTGVAGSKKAVFVESSIDALSYQALFPESLVIATAGSSKDLVEKAAQSLEKNGFRVIAGFDADKAGDMQSQRLLNACKNAERHCPEQGKDWNEQLQREQQQKQEQSFDQGHEICR